MPITGGVESVRLGSITQRPLTSSEFQRLQWERAKARAKEERKRMAFVTFAASMSPIVQRGKASTPQVTVSNKGRLAFSAAASRIIADDKLVRYDFDRAAGLVIIIGAKVLPKGADPGTYFEIPKRGKDGVVSLACAGLLTLLGHKYGEVGNVVCAVEVDEKAHKLSFNLKRGVPKPVVHRVKKAKAPEEGDLQPE